MDDPPREQGHYRWACEGVTREYLHCFPLTTKNCKESYVFAWTKRVVVQQKLSVQESGCAVGCSLGCSEGWSVA